MSDSPPALISDLVRAVDHARLCVVARVCCTQISGIALWALVFRPKGAFECAHQCDLFV